MNKVEYKPTPGYFDLTEKPKGMRIVQHKKVQHVQMVFINEANKYRDPEVRIANDSHFRMLQERMAELQMVILKYWGESCFSK